MILEPFKLLRKRASIAFIPALPVVIIVLYIIWSTGASDSGTLVKEVDNYLGGNMYLAAGDLTKYENLSANVLLPLIRLGGVAEQTNIKDMLGGDTGGGGGKTMDFLVVFFVLFLAFISYAMTSKVIYDTLTGGNSIFGTEGINPSTIILSAVASFLVIFIASFAFVGFKLFLMVNFGIIFTFAMPHAAIGKPVFESFFQGFKTLQNSLGNIVQAYIACMGAAIMTPIAILLFLFPLIINLNNPAISDLLKLLLGLLSLMFGLFYQQAICAHVVYTAAGLRSLKMDSKATEPSQGLKSISEEPDDISDAVERAIGDRS